MNRIFFAIIIVFISVFAFQFCGNNPDKVQEERQAPLSIAENSNDFNNSFARMLGSYYTLKDAFVASDTAKINETSKLFKASVDSLNTSEISGDSTGAIKATAGSFVAAIGNAAAAVSGEKDIDAKRKQLNVITDNLWSLTRTVKYDGEKVYYQFCPMAFKNQGAYWLSNSRQIRNPYFGDKMLTCGETADSLDYSKRQ